MVQSWFCSHVVVTLVAMQTIQVEKEMTDYPPIDPNVEVIGQNMLSFIQNTRAGTIRPTLNKYGLGVIDPEKWYLLSKWVEVMNTVARGPTGMSDLVAIGLAITKTALLPPDIENMTYPQFAMLADETYQINHRNGYAGEIKTEIVAEQHARYTIHVPYPDDLEYGVFYGFARRFLGPEPYLIVSYDEEEKRRADGGVHTIINVEWED